MEHEHEFYYYPHTNEAGWKCAGCGLQPGEPPGFSPELDRREIYHKISGLLIDLHERNFFYVPNGTSGDIIVHEVIKRCQKEKRFDQYSIVQYIFEADKNSHAKYWSHVSDGILVGADPRDRCECGKLAEVHSGGKPWCISCHNQEIERKWRN